MSSSEFTLEQALQRARQLGLGNSVLERAIAGFEQREPSAQPNLGDAFGPLGDIFKKIVPQGARDVLGGVAQRVTSGEQFLNVPGGPQLGTQTIGRAPGPLRNILDIALAPTTVGTVGTGPALSTAMKAGPRAVQLAAPLVSPFFDGAPLSRLAVETAAAFAGQQLSGAVLERLPEDAPMQVRIGAMLAAGAAGAGAVGGVAQGLRAGARGAERAGAIPDIALGPEFSGLPGHTGFYGPETGVPRIVSTEHPAYVPGGPLFRPGEEPGSTLFRPTQAGSVENFVLPGMDPGDPALLVDAAQQARSAGMRAYSLGESAPELPITPELDRLMARFEDARQFLARDETSPIPTDDPYIVLKRLQPERLERMLQAKAAEAQFSNTTPAFKTAMKYLTDAKIGEDPHGQIAAEVWGAWGTRQRHFQTLTAQALRPVLDDVFGSNLELVSMVQHTTPDLVARWVDIRRDFPGYLATQNHGAALTTIIQNPKLFNLTDAQREVVEAIADTFTRSFDRAEVHGVPLAGRRLDYAPQREELVDILTDKAARGSDVALRFAHLTGNQRGFQRPRMFDDLTEVVNQAIAAKKGRGAWNEWIQRAISRARDMKDDAEVSRLAALYDSGYYLRPKNVDFEVLFADRLNAATDAIAEHMMLQAAAAHGPDAIARVRDLTANHAMSRSQALVQGFASVPRSVILRFDLSFLGQQFASGLVMGNGVVKASRRMGADLVRAVMTDDGWMSYNLNQADFIARNMDWGLVLPNEAINTMAEETVNDVLTGHIRIGQRPYVDPISGDVLPIGKSRGTNINLPGNAIRAFDKYSLGRALSILKNESANYLVDLAVASKEHGWVKALMEGHPFFGSTVAKHPEWSLDEIGRGVMAHLNDLDGGRSRVALGRTQQHAMVENLIMLTPGWTRGTLNLFKQGLTRGGVEGALARDFMLRGLVLANLAVTAFTVSINGLVDGKLALPEYDPRKSNWLDIPVPGGRAIRPFSRFRSLAASAVTALDDAVTKDPIEGLRTGSENYLRWASYRQSALVSNIAGDPIGALGKQIGLNTGNSFARGFSLQDMVFNPSVDRQADLADMLQANLPAAVQELFSNIRANGASPRAIQDAAIAVGANFLGAGSFGPTMLERQVSTTGADLAEGKMDQAIIDQTVAEGRDPVNARGVDGAYVLDKTTRDRLHQEVAAKLNIPVELANRGGRMPPRERAEFVRAQEQQQVTTFFDGTKEIDAAYLNGNPRTGQPGVAQLTQAVNQGILSPSQFSKMLTDLRMQRAAAKDHLLASAPAASVFLSSSKHRDSQNAKDAMFSLLSAQAFGEDFYDPQTMTYDFDAQQQVLDKLQASYPYWYDQWVQNRDAKKAPMELERDEAMRRLAGYFDVADGAWQSLTGGVLGRTEREFDTSLRKSLVAQGVADPAIQTLIMRQLKQGIPAIQEAQQFTTQMREIMRRNPRVEADVTKWLGLVPLAGR